MTGSSSLPSPQTLHNRRSITAALGLPFSIFQVDMVDVALEPRRAVRPWWESEVRGSGTSKCAVSFSVLSHDFKARNRLLCTTSWYR